MDAGPCGGSSVPEQARVNLLPGYTGFGLGTPVLYGQIAALALPEPEPRFGYQSRFWRKFLVRVRAQTIDDYYFL